jgi:phenylacetate-CoA ligase
MSPDPTTAKALSIMSRYRTLRSTYKFLQKSQWWSAAEIEAYQLQRLKTLLTHAYANVPYYHATFNERGVVPSDIRDIADLERLPFLTKDVAREHMRALTARNYAARDLEPVQTSGSTGTPLWFYYEKGTSRAREMAFVRSAWGRVGYRFVDKCSVLRDDIISSNGAGKFYEKRLFGRWLTLSSRAMRPENLATYVHLVAKFKPKFIQAFPSSITILAKYMQENQLGRFPTVKALLCGSESLAPWQRDLIEAVFRCKVFSWYGQSEQVAFASECEVSRKYHLFPEYGIVELVDPRGQPILKSGEVGEIVATGFNNPAVPFIRYRTGDLAQYADSTCECGRHHALLDRIEGRANEYVVDRNGGMIPITTIWMTRDVINADFDGVSHFQFFQDAPGKLILNIVPGKDYEKCGSEQMFGALRRRLGADMDLEIRLVDHIPRSDAGKHRWLVQKLPIGFGQ